MGLIERNDKPIMQSPSQSSSDTGSLKKSGVKTSYFLEGMVCFSAEDEGIVLMGRDMLLCQLSMNLEEKIVGIYKVVVGTLTFYDVDKSIDSSA